MALVSGTLKVAEFSLETLRVLVGGHYIAVQRHLESFRIFLLKGAIPYGQPHVDRALYRLSSHAFLTSHPVATAITLKAKYPYIYESDCGPAEIHYFFSVALSFC